MKKYVALILPILLMVSGCSSNNDNSKPPVDYSQNIDIESIAGTVQPLSYFLDNEIIRLARNDTSVRYVKIDGKLVFDTINSEYIFNKYYTPEDTGEVGNNFFSQLFYFRFEYQYDSNAHDPIASRKTNIFVQNADKYRLYLVFGYDGKSEIIPMQNEDVLLGTKLTFVSNDPFINDIGKGNKPSSSKYEEANASGYGFRIYDHYESADLGGDFFTKNEDGKIVANDSEFHSNTGVTKYINSNSGKQYGGFCFDLRIDRTFEYYKDYVKHKGTEDYFASWPLDTTYPEYCVGVVYTNPNDHNYFIDMTEERIEEVRNRIVNSMGIYIQKI